MKFLRYTLSALLLSFILLCSCDTPTDIKVISYNIRLGTGKDCNNSWEHRKHASINMIRTEQPTIVGVQEALAFQLEYLLDSLPDYEMIGVGRDDGIARGEHMAILYRSDEVELLQWGTFWLSDTPEVPSFGWDAACRRTCTWAKFRHRTTGAYFAHLNTHLDHKGAVAQSEGLRLIAEQIHKLIPARMPLFLTGDLNITPDNEALKMLENTLLDARAVATDSDTRNTYNGWGNKERSKLIDYIFLRGAEATTFRVLCDENYGAPYISDHYPIALSATIK